MCIDRKTTTYIASPNLMSGWNPPTTIVCAYAFCRRQVYTTTSNDQVIVKTNSLPFQYEVGAQGAGRVRRDKDGGGFMFVEGLASYSMLRIVSNT